MNLQDEVKFQSDNFNQLKKKYSSAESYRSGKEHRLSCIQLSEQILKTKIKGNCLELGAGTGYFSAYLLANRPETFVTLLECTYEAKEVIQSCIKAHSITEERYQILIGDFTEFTLPNSMDYVFVMGALHHSYALEKTMTKIYENLKPSGYLIAHEPAFDDFASREHLQHHYQQRLGIDPTQEEPTLPRHDFFFRECEYRRAAIASGLDLITWKRLEKKTKISWKRKLKSLVKSFSTKLENKSNPTDKSKQTEDLKSYLMIFQKPPSSVGLWIPHKSLL